MASKEKAIPPMAAGDILRISGLRIEETSSGFDGRVYRYCVLQLGHVVICKSNIFYSSRSVTSVTGGQGDPIVPRQIGAGSSWSWDEKDDVKVKELRGWWKERCDIQTGATDAAACSPPLKEFATNPASFNATITTSCEQDQQFVKSGVTQNPLFKLPAPQAQSVSKKQKVGPASTGAAVTYSVRQEGRLSGDIRVTELRKFMQAEKLSSFHKHLIGFKDLLLKKGISKVLMSGFVNGEGGHVKVPESLLGTMADSQLLFIVCPEQC